MSGKLLDDLGQLQRAVIEVVWELGEASVHQVRKRLSRKKKLAYTTVLTAMQKLEKAGWLRHRTEGKSYIYAATRTREQAGAKSVRKFMERMFDGDTLSRIFLVELSMAEHAFYHGRPGKQFHSEASLGKGTSGAVFSDDCSSDCANDEHLSEALWLGCVCRRAGCNSIAR